MNEELYTIKPLKWTCTKSGYWVQYESSVGLSVYRVQRNREDFDEDKPWGPWRWGYCFAEYHDEYETECASLAEGKRLCWEDWLSRLLPNLKRVTETKHP